MAKEGHSLFNLDIHKNGSTVNRDFFIKDIKLISLLISKRSTDYSEKSLSFLRANFDE